VYIIDEVHMLSAGAFNALLKTLEEPPSHVIFILATTEIHKVPETIISRCQRFDFSRLTLEQIVKKLSWIAKEEKVEIEKEALEMISIAAEGGMRDAESLLAQIIALEDKNITAKEVENILGAARHESVENLAALILEKNTGKALDLTAKLSEEGINFEVFVKSLLNHFRQLMIVSVDSNLAALFSLELTKEQIEKIQDQAKNHSPKEILAILENIIESQQKIRSSFIPSLPIEIAIVKSTQPIKSNVERDSQLEARPDLTRPDSVRPMKRDNPPLAENDKKLKAGKPAPESSITLDLVRNSWSRITKATLPVNHSIAAFLSNCEPVKIENNTIIIATKYNFYKDKLNDKSIRSTIEEVIGKILNSSVKVKFVTEEEAGVTLTKQPAADLPADAAHQALQEGNQQQKRGDSLLDDAMKIMGGKIVEE
jgi:DNA polymerase-3 subunit gamma/tau